MWLTAPAGRPERPRRPVAGDVVSPLDAAGELIARRDSGLRDSGLTAFTNCLGDVVSDGPVWASSLAVFQHWSLMTCAAHVDRLRTAYFAVVDTLDGVEQERAALDACQSSPAADSSVRRRCGRAVRDLQEEQLRLHVLLETAVRIGVFDPAAVSGEPRGVGRLV